MGLNAEDTEDVAQEVYVRLFRDDCAVLQGWRGTGELGAYIRKIALNCVHDHIRAGGRRVPTLVLDPSRDSPDETEDPEATALLDELRRMMHEAIALLTQRQQSVIRAIVLEELTYRETADRLRMTPNAVGVAYSEAKTALERVIERDYPSLRLYMGVGPNNFATSRVNVEMGWPPRS
jgi:RNA polymerase sigma factor (sigma-70 family)